MTKTSWKKLQTIFEQAIDKPEAERENFVKISCGEDLELLKAVNQLLLADNENKFQENASFSINLSNIDEQLIGSIIDDWEIKELIGSGGMGSVFRAEKHINDFNQVVALKIVKKGMDSESVVRRFQQERQILANLNHPNIAHLIDGGVTEDGRPYFAMELCQGLPITEYCDNNHLNIQQRLVLFQSACESVHYAHKNLVVHRDLKPSNIIVTNDGELKLLDFGIAKLLDDSEDNQLTKTGIQIHTPAYASPEQLTNDSITTVSDIYSLGILLYELLSGKRPFEIKRSQKELLQLILSEEPLKPSEALTNETILFSGGDTKTLSDISLERCSKVQKLQKDLSGDLDVICLTAMHKEPERRYTSANEFGEDIKRHLNGEPVLARVDSFFYRLQKLIKRNISTTVISVVALFSIVALSIFYTFQLTEQRDIAIIEKEKAEQVVEFITGLFQVADPSESKGEDVKVKDILDEGVKQIESDLTNQSQVRLMLQRVMAEVYYNLGADESAKELLEKTLQEHLNSEFKDQPEIAITQILIGFIHQDWGNYEKAEPLYLNAHKMQKEFLPNDHFELVETLNIIGSFEQMRGDFKKAELKFREAIEMAQRLTSDEHEFIAESLENLGGVLRILDKNEEAEKILREALSMQMKLYEDGIHPEIDDTKKEIAGLLRNMRRFDEAKPLLEEVIESRTKMLGDSHIEVGNAWNSYSHLLSNMGDLKGAIHANQMLIDITFRAHSGPHPSLAAAYHNRALLLKDDNQLNEAIEHFKLSIDMQDKVGLPKRHVNRSYPMSGMARIHLDKKEYLIAKELYEQVLSLRLEAFSEDHLLVMDTKSDIAATLIGLKEFTLAEKLLVECYQHFIQSRNADDPRTERAARRLVKLFQENGDKTKETEFMKQFKLDGVTL